MTPARRTVVHAVAALAAAAATAVAGCPVAAAAPAAAGSPAPSAAELPPAGLDPAFGEHGLAALPADAPGGGAFDLAATPDGGVVAVGRAPAGGGWWAAKLDRDGRPDGGFGGGDGVAEVVFDGTSGGEWGDHVYSVAVDGAGRIVLAGEWGPQAESVAALARLRPDGSLDTGFDGDGRKLFHFDPDARFSMPDALHVAPGGEIAVAGSWRSRTPSFDPHFESLVTFASDGAIAQGPRVLMQLEMANVKDLARGPDGRLAAAGDMLVESLLSVRTPALDPAPGFADPWHADLSSGQKAENGLHDTLVRADGGLLAVGFTTSLTDPWHYRGTTAAFGTGGDGPRVQEIAGPPGEDLWLQAVAQTGGGPVAVGAVGSLVSGETFQRPVVVPVGADGLPDPARGGVQPVALPPSPGGRTVGATDFSGSGEVVQLVSLRDAGGAWTQRIARTELGAAAGAGDPGRGPGENPGRGPGEDPGRGPGEDPGRGPGEDPGTGPGEDPGRGPGAGRRPSGGGPGGSGARPAARVRFSPVGRGPVTALRGTVSEPGAAVVVALARVERGRCRTMPLGRSGPCRPVRWLPARADGRDRWTLRLRVGPGRYRAWARAAPRAGRTARPLTRAAGNAIAFRVR